LFLFEPTMSRGSTCSPLLLLVGTTALPSSSHSKAVRRQTQDVFPP
jgi:hypothetical protein